MQYKHFKDAYGEQERQEHHEEQTLQEPETLKNTHQKHCIEQVYQKISYVKQDMVNATNNKKNKLYKITLEYKPAVRAMQDLPPNSQQKIILKRRSKQTQWQCNTKTQQD